MQLIWFGMSRDEIPDGCHRGAYFVNPDDETAPACYYRVSTEFKVIDGRRMPLWMEVENATGISEPGWGARVELVAGVPKIVNIGFETRYGFDLGREVKAADFQIAREIIYTFYAAACAEVDEAGEPVFRIGDTEADRRIREFLERRRTGRQRLKTADYQRASQVYRDNFQDTPTQAVAEAFGVGIRQAGNIVAECRRRKLLPATKQGRKKA